MFHLSPDSLWGQMTQAPRHKVECPRNQAYFLPEVETRDQLVSCFVSLSAHFLTIFNCLTPWSFFHYDLATVSHTKKELESYHPIIQSDNQSFYQSARATGGKIVQVFIVRGFQLTAALKPPTMLLFEAPLARAPRQAMPSRTKGTERSQSLIHRFSSGQGTHSGAIVCSKSSATCE